MGEQEEILTPFLGLMEEAQVAVAIHQEKQGGKMVEIPLRRVKALQLENLENSLEFYTLAEVVVAAAGLTKELLVLAGLVDM